MTASNQYTQYMMNETLKSSIDEIWQSRDPVQEAILQASMLGDRVDNQLERIAQKIWEKAIQNDVTDPSSKEAPSTSRSSMLWLLMQAIHHSDSLIYLPVDLREARLEEWSKTSKLPLSFVRAAAALGPYYLSK